jgi:hypothetical protein
VVGIGWTSGVPAGSECRGGSISPWGECVRDEQELWGPRPSCDGVLCFGGVPWMIGGTESPGVLTALWYRVAEAGG